MWDENEETAVQSPLGGTKISWGGPPVEPQHGSNRQRFDLVTDDLSGETDRLISLGATRLGALADGTELKDVDGNKFGLHTAIDVVIRSRASDYLRSPAVHGGDGTKVNGD